MDLKTAKYYELGLVNYLIYFSLTQYCALGLKSDFFFQLSVWPVGPESKDYHESMILK